MTLLLMETHEGFRGKPLADKATAEAVRIATEEALREVQSGGKCDHLGVCCDVQHLNIFQY